MRVILLFFVSFILVSCGEDANKDNKESVENNNKQSFNSKEFNTILQSQHVAITSSGNLAYLIKKDDNLIYSDQDNTVTLKNTPAKRYWLKVSGNYVYIFWWVKYNTHEQKDTKKAGKTLYVNVSDNGGKTFSEPRRLNDYHGVLPDLHIVADKNGHITIVYLDERYDGHQIFTNSSQDGGKTWLKHDVELNQPSIGVDDVNKGKKRITNAVTPNLQKVGNNLVVVWEQVELFNGKQGISFYSRTSLDFGKTWSKQELIYRDFEHISVELYLTSTGSEMYLFAVLNQGLVVFVKESKSKWSRIKGYVPGTDKGNTDLVSYFKTAFDDDYLYITYINVEGKLKTDNHTEFQAFHRKNKIWEKKFRFDTLKSSEAEFARSYFQDITILEDGTLIVVWEDYRSIFPSILMNYSIDQGKTWQEKPFPLNKMGLESASRPFVKSIKNKFSVFYSYYVLANAIKPITVTRKISFPSPKSLEFAKISFPEYTLPSKSKSLSLLKERVKALMKLRTTKKSIESEQKEWMYLDPIYKASKPQLDWMKARDMFNYINYKVENITVKGSMAFVKISLSYKMSSKFSAIKHNNKDGSPQENEVSIMKWGWFYDNWYLIPDNPRQSYLP